MPMPSSYAAFAFAFVCVCVCAWSVAQPDALALGRTAEQLLALEPGIDPKTIPHRVFPGNRPSLSLLFPQLDAYTAGQMLALYEHRTAVQVKKR